MMSFEIMQLTKGSGSLSSYLDFISQIPRLDEDAEKELTTAVFFKRCKESAQKILFHHLRLVAFLAKRYERPNIPLQDLIQEGNVALMVAISNYNPSKENAARVATFAARYIVGAFKEYIRKNLKIIAIGTTKAVKKAINNLSKYTQSGELSLRNKYQMAQDLAIDVSDVETAYQQYNLSCVSTQASENEDELEYSIPDNRYDPSKLLLQYEREIVTPKEMIKSIARLPKMEQDILTRRYLNDSSTTLVELSKEYGVSFQRIAQIESKAISKLKDIHFS
jgi:RNA polymerase sigma-32 factor